MATGSFSMWKWNEEGLGGNRSSEQMPAGTPLDLTHIVNMSELSQGPKVEDFLGATTSTASQYTYCNPPVNFIDTTSLYDGSVIAPLTGSSRLKSSPNLAEFQNSAPYVYPFYNLPECSTWMLQQACGYPSAGMKLLQLQDFNQSSKYSYAPEKEIITPPESRGDSQDLLFGCNLRLHHNPAGAESVGNMQLSSELANMKTMLRQPAQSSKKQTAVIATLSGLNSFSLSINPISEANPPIDVAATENSSYAGKAKNAVLYSMIDCNTPKKTIETIGQARTSQYRGVTRHRWTKRYEAHLWDNSYKIEGKSRKGKQGSLCSINF